MNHHALAAAASAALLLAGCAGKQESPAPAPAAEPAAPAVDIAAEEQAIRNRSGEWMNFMNAQDASSLGGVYAPDAVSIYDGTVTHGGPAIVAGVEKNFGANPKAVYSWTTDSLRIADSGDLAVETGTLHIDLDGAEGKKAPTDGAFVTVWEKVDGAWRVAADTGTDDMKKPEGDGASAN